MDCEKHRDGLDEAEVDDLLEEMVRITVLNGEFPFG
jgi:hypothetical protein